MSLEAWSTLASVGTFVVITATAIAAVLQLRHMRAANKVTYIQAFFSQYEGAELREAFRFVRVELARRLEDPAFRQELRVGRIDRIKHPEVTICNFFDQWGLYYRDGVSDRESFLRVNAGVIDTFWTILEPVIALQPPGNRAWEQFEYLTVEARRWLARHPEGSYPKGATRLPLVDRYAAEDNQAKLG
jgi:hypothetical protein